jgi:hypothetical protein
MAKSIARAVARLELYAPRLSFCDGDLNSEYIFYPHSGLRRFNPPIPLCSLSASLASSAVFSWKAPNLVCARKKASSTRAEQWSTSADL